MHSVHCDITISYTNARLCRRLKFLKQVKELRRPLFVYREAFFFSPSMVQAKFDWTFVIGIVLSELFFFFFSMVLFYPERILVLNFVEVTNEPSN